VPVGVALIKASFKESVSKSWTPPRSSVLKLLHIAGGGTPASPTFGTIIHDATNRFNFVADDGLSGSYSPNSIAMWGYNLGSPATNADRGNFVFDAMTSGSLIAGDKDPYVMKAWRDLGWSISNNHIFDETMLCWFSKGSNINIPAFVSNLAGLTLYGHNSAFSNSIINGTVATNVLTGLEETFPVIYTRRSQLGTGGLKGESSLMKFQGILRGNGVTFSLTNPATTKDRIAVDYVSMPWDETTVPII
jgi:hypothetical protein